MDLSFLSRATGIFIEMNMSGGKNPISLKRRENYRSSTLLSEKRSPLEYNIFFCLYQKFLQQQMPTTQKNILNEIKHFNYISFNDV